MRRFQKLLSGNNILYSNTIQNYFELQFWLLSFNKNHTLNPKVRNENIYKLQLGMVLPFMKKMPTFLLGASQK